MLQQNTQTCPACNSLNLWTDDHEGATYKHCYECTFCWDRRMELRPGLVDYAALVFYLSVGLSLSPLIKS